ncbi:uncharacterized protein [Pyrus communis]|uniref:uncharacterized protein n=1 Tax=Pyrus communis TaxID=23211 RepID=UPI0035C1E2BC
MAEDNLFDSEAESFTAPRPSFPEAEVNPNQRLCSVLLNEFNYLPWSRSISLALGGRSKLGFVNESIEAPDVASPEYEAWLCKDQLVMSWLLNSMDPKLSEIFSFSESSSALWKAVKDMYGNQNNAARVFQLKRNLASLQQDRCWILHPELKPRFENKPLRDHKGSHARPHTNKYHAAATSIGGSMNFTANPADLLNEFSTYLQTRKGSTGETSTGESQTALLGQFAGFLAESGHDLATKKLIGEGHYLNGLYYFSEDLNVPKGFQVSSNLEHWLWHQRLAHPSESVLSTLFPSLCKSSLVCEICHLSKSTRLSFNSSMSRTSKLFEMVHSDVWGPAPLESFDGYRYYVIFVDDFSRATWLYLLKFKSEVMDAFKDFHNLVMNHFSSQIHILRSDNGTEYTSKNMTNYLSTHGIIHQTSCVGTPQQNGIAERKNWDLLEKTRALMLQMNVPKRFWSQGVLAATYLINRLPSRVLDTKSPSEVMQNKKGNLSHLRIFGCTCYVHIQSHHRDKLDPKAVKCVFMGYSSTQKGYKLDLAISDTTR